MARRPLELPPAVARAFVADMEAYVAAPTGLDKDAIAARQLRSLREHVPGKLRLTDVIELFVAMREDVPAPLGAGRAAQRRRSTR